MWNFETDVTFEFENTLLVEDRVKVKWTLELEIREWGIKSFIVTVPEQVIRFEERNGDDEIPREIVLKNVNVMYITGEEVSMSFPTIAPSVLTIYKGKIELAF